MPAPLHNPRVHLSKAWLKQPVPADRLDTFMRELTRLKERIDEAPHEENAKACVRDFLRGTFYGDLEVNIPQGRIDLAIHNGAQATDPVAVIIEAKRPVNQAEMPRPGAENVKGLHELLLYYLREREAGNMAIRHLVATNGKQWWVSDENWWDQNAFRDAALMKAYRQDQELAKDTDRFYKQIAKPFFDRAGLPPYAFADLADLGTDRQRLDLYKLLAPEHLLKRPFANDSNTLNTAFYHELLYLLGLEEVKEGGRKMIKRPPEARRQPGSLLENTIVHLRANGKLGNLETPEAYGTTEEDQLFSIGLELCITWLNRILFLKLLEGQLLRYHPGQPGYAFLTPERLPEYDDLNELFFQVLNQPEEQRTGRRAAAFAQVPYLNSMLFEPSELERLTENISSLGDREELPYYAQTVLKDPQGRRRQGADRPLRYLLEFLQAYDFGAESDGQVQTQGKALINAAVLGLIFEKINGYKDGSFFTPGYITQYMCRQALEPAAVARLNEAFGWECQTLAEAKDRIDFLDPAVRQTANVAIERLRVCDPAVGSGHFLVSALNELLRIKAYLGIWQDGDGQRIRGYALEVEHDELLVYDEEAGELFAYGLNKQNQPRSRDAQRVQQSLFTEKQKLIENCLYGADINPKSVAICRLRLWIELLKHAYYTPESQFARLETLPNLDINIACGNSLVSRFSLEGPPDVIKAARDNLRRLVEDMRTTVDAYRLARKAPAEKNQLRKRLRALRNQFVEFTPRKDATYEAVGKLEAEVAALQMSINNGATTGQLLLNQRLQDLTAAQEAWAAKKAFYRNALEWRLEFPSLLSQEPGEEGMFLGFDVVIGNPPYIRQEELGTALKTYLKQGYQTYAGTADLYVYFVELGLRLLRAGGHFHYILPNKWMRAGYGRPLRLWARRWQQQALVDFGDLPVFDEATTYPLLWHMQKAAPRAEARAATLATLQFDEGSLEAHLATRWSHTTPEAFTAESWSLASSSAQNLLGKMREAGTPLGAYVEGKIFYGIKTGYNKAFVIDAATRARLIAEDPGSADIIKPFLAGRDVKRYVPPVANKYLLFTRRGFDIERYPAILHHLEGFRAQLEPKSKDAPKDAPGRKPGTYKWYEIQDSVDYYSEFERPKIIIANFLNHSAFTFDAGVLHGNDKTNIIGSTDYNLLGVLNSKLLEFYMKQIASTKQNGYFEYKPVYLAQLPIIHSGKIGHIVTQILAAKADNPQADTAALERAIDEAVYALYQLTPAEIALVEQQA